MPNSPGETLTADYTQTFATSLTGPGNGETIEEDDVNEPLQMLLDTVNRAGKLYIATPADLPTAVSNAVDGERFLVRDYGLYEYRSGSAAGLVTNWIVDGPGSVGRFHHVLYGRLNVTRGVAGLDASTKLLATVVPNRLVGVYTGGTAGGSITASTSYVDATGDTLSLGSLNVGDIIWGTAIIDHVTESGSTGLSIAALGVYEGATLASLTYPSTSNYQSGSGAENATRRAIHPFVHAVTAAGAVSLQVLHKTDNVTYDSLIVGAQFNAMVIRP